MDRSLASPQVFCAALAEVPPSKRDAWIDDLLGIACVPEDGPDLPRGCVPYLPCGVQAVLDSVALAEVNARDVVVDVGAGIGRAALLIHLLTGARVVGLEIQAGLLDEARALTARLGVAGVEFIGCDATSALEVVPTATVLFLYCPFAGGRLERLLDAVEPLERSDLRLACVDMPVLTRPGLTLRGTAESSVAVYQSLKRP